MNEKSEGIYLRLIERLEKQVVGLEADKERLLEQLKKTEARPAAPSSKAKPKRKLTKAQRAQRERFQVIPGGPA